MKDSFEVQGYTIPNSGKEKNGDSYAFEYFEKDGLLLAAVADGVSRQPCDWLASETTCRNVIVNFAALSDQANIKNRLRESIIRTNQKLIETEGQCHKMASTLSAVVLDTNRSILYYSNIGDSRIFILDTGKFSQLTKDDSIVTKERVYANGSVRVVDKHTLTKVIGQERISVDVLEAPTTKGQIIILGTDGFYDARKASFNKIMEQFETSSSFAENFKLTIDKLEILRGDDFTVVMIKVK